MYESYFNFSKKPFSLLPDANFLYLSKNHSSALTMLRYGLESRAFITVITGDIGCGKTTLCRKLLDEVTEDVTIGLITNTHSAFGDPLKWVLLAFDLDHRDKSKVEQYETLVEFMIAEYAQNRYTVLIVDEAQNLNDSALEELRMLSNINADEHQILQLVLVGQPELRDALKRPELKQFAQRVSADYHIYPLDLEETENYIQHRLEVVGGDPGLFLPETYPLIQAHSDGVPRLINIVCDTALVYAYGAQENKVDLDLIEEVIKDRERGVYFNHSRASSDRYSNDSDNSEDERSTIVSDSGRKPRMDSAFKRLDEQVSEPIASAPEPEEVRVQDKENNLQAGRPNVSSNEFEEDTEIRTENNIGQGSSTVSKESQIFDKPRVSDEVRAHSKESEDNVAFAHSSPPSTPQVEENQEAKEQFLDMTAELEKPRSRTTLYSILVLFVLFAGVYLSQNPSLITSLFPQGEQSQIEVWVSEADGYLKVLAADPENTEAKSGIQTIKESLLSSAEIAREQGDWDVARNHVQALLTIDPQSTKAQDSLKAIGIAEEIALGKEEKISQEVALVEMQGWLDEADGYFKAGHLVEPKDKNAYARWAKVLGREPDNAAALAGIFSLKEALFATSDAAQATGDLDSARGLLNGLLAFEPDNAQAHEALRVVDEKHKLVQLKGAEQAEIQTLLDEAEGLLKATQLAEPDAVEAYRLFQSVIELESNNAAAQAGQVAVIDKLFTVAGDAQAEGDWRTSRSQLRAVLLIEPQNQKARQAIADLTSAETASIASAERASTIKSWLASTQEYLNSGQLIEPVGANAYEYFGKVLELDPNNEVALAGIVTLKDLLFSNANKTFKEENWDLARSQFEKLLSIEPQSERAAQGLTAITEGEQAQAQAIAEAEIQSWLAEANEFLAAGQLLTPEDSNAYAIFNRVLERKADQGDALAGIEAVKDAVFDRAMAAQDEGNWALARQQLQAILGIAPQNDQIRQGLLELDKLEAAALAQAAAEAEIQKWLDEANEYLGAGQLLEPQEENAYALFAKVLERTPENAAALAGITTIKDRLLSVAAQAESEGYWDQARNQLQALLKIEPNSERGHKALSALSEVQATAETQLELQNWLSAANNYLDDEQLVEPPEENAYALFSKVLGHEPDNSVALAGLETIKEALLLSASQAQAAQNWSDARGRLQALLQIEPQSDRGELALSKLNAAEQASIAQLAAQEQVKQWLDQANEFIQLGQLILPAGENAYEVLNKVLVREPENTEALEGIVSIKDTLFTVATKSQAKGEWGLARSLLQALLNIEPENDRSRKALVALAEAEESANVAATDQNEIQALLSQADSYIASGRLIEPVVDNAYEVLNKVLQRDAANVMAQAKMTELKDTLFATAQAAQTQGDWRQARRQLQALLLIDPQASRGTQALADLTLAENNARAKEIEKTEIAAWLVEIDQYLKEPQLLGPTVSNLRGILQKILDRDPQNIDALARMATLKDRLFLSASMAQAENDWSLARTQLQAISDIEPQSERVQDAFEALALAEQKSNEPIVDTPPVDVETPAPVSEDESIDQDILDFLMRGGEAVN